MDRPPSPGPHPPRTIGARRGAATAAATALLVAGLVGCSGGAELAAEDAVATTAIEVVDDDFAPAVVTVPVGTEVTWTWSGRRQHDVVADGIDSGRQVEGTFTHTPTEPGTIAYRCTLHRGMEGLLVVTDPDGEEGA